MNDPDRYRLSAEQHERIFRKRIIPRLTSSIQAVEHPRAVIFGGQPGAGKSALQTAAEKELQATGGLLEIVGDDLRAYHPLYTKLLRLDDKTAAFYTDRDSGQWIEKLIAYGKEQKFNLVIEGTMRVPDKVSQTMRDLRAAGYFIDARAIAVDGRISTLGIHQRYEDMVEDRGHGRFTVAHSHEAAYIGMPTTVEHIERERLADRMAVYRRGNVLLYENRLQYDVWIREPAAREAVEAERARPWTQEERTAYARGWEHVLEQMRRRNAPEAEQAVAIEALRNQSGQSAHDISHARSPAALIPRRQHAPYQAESPEDLTTQHPRVRHAHALVEAAAAKVFREPGRVVATLVRHYAANPQPYAIHDEDVLLGRRGLFGDDKARAAAYAALPAYYDAARGLRAAIATAAAEQKAQAEQRGERDQIPVPAPSATLATALATRTPHEIASDPTLMAEVRTIQTALYERYGRPEAAILASGSPEEAAKLLPEGLTLDELRTVLQPLRASILAEGEIAYSRDQQRTMMQEGPRLGHGR